MLFLESFDQVKIALREFSPRAQFGESCYLVVPGFLEHSGSKIFEELCKELAVKGETVFCLDLRGTGKSEGRYSFGKFEYYDVLAAIQYLKKTFSEIILIGFSLGAYSSLRAHCESPEAIKALFLVSLPTSIHEIIFGGHAARHALGLLMNKFAQRKSRSFKIRLTHPFAKIPSAFQFAQNANAPIHLLVGSQDLLVPASMSQKVFDQINSPTKTWRVFTGGVHAELLYYHNPTSFMEWLANP